MLSAAYDVEQNSYGTAYARLHMAELDLLMQLVLSLTWALRWGERRVQWTSGGLYSVVQRSDEVISPSLAVGDVG